MLITDIRLVIQDLYQATWPYLGGKKSRVVTKTVIVNRAAERAGIDAGRKADLAAHPDKRVGSQPELRPGGEGA